MEPRRRGRATIHDVAAEAGVSKSLVSLVLRGKPGAGAETRERVHRVAAELGYSADPAAGMLARSARRVIGVTATLHNPFHADLVDRIYPLVEQRGYHVLLSGVVPSRTAAEAVDSLIRFRSDGVLLLGPSLGELNLDRLAEQTVLVAVGVRTKAAGVTSVHANEARGTRLLIDHLVSLGHQRIVHIDGGNMPASIERRRAYRAAMRRHGLDREVHVLAGDHTESSGARAMRQILSSSPSLPTAVFAYNDRSAVGVLDALFREGLRVPEDISVVGYDDSALAQLPGVRLTTVNQNPTRQAELAVDAVLAQIEGRQMEITDTAVDPRLVERATTAAPRSE